jgi:integrase
VEVSKARGDFIDASAARAIIRDLGAEWLASQTHLKPSAYRSVESSWRIWVRPMWANWAVGDIRHSEVQAWVTRIAAERGSTTVARAYGVLAAILDVAVRDRRIHSNAARGVNLPRKSAKRRVYLTHDRVDLLASNVGPKKAFVYILAYTGLRWGEATGLLVKDLNLESRRLSVVENAVAVSGKIIVGTPKSHKVRSVAFSAFLVPLLEEVSRGKTQDEILFGNGATHIRLPDSRRGWFANGITKSRAVDEGFPRVTPHDLRHTAASLAIAAGANVKAVQRMLGHASAAMTLDTYADLFEDDLDQVADAMERAREGRNSR